MMNSIQAVIIDDEEKIREVILMKLNRHCPEVKILGQAGDADSGEALLRDVKPQLVFLDISMPRGSGFDMLARFDKVDFDVIFVTGYREFALQALRISAVDYLLKPISDEELIEAVKKATERINGRKIIANYDHLQHNLDHIKDQRAKISIPSHQSYDQIAISEIIRCEGEQRYTRVHLKSGKSILSSYSIGVFSDLLQDYDFYFTHKSHLVNTQCIVRYLREGVAVMNDGSQVPVARRKREEFKAHILQMVADGKRITPLQGPIDE